MPTYLQPLSRGIMRIKIAQMGWFFVESAVRVLYHAIGKPGPRSVALAYVVTAGLQQPGAVLAEGSEMRKFNYMAVVVLLMSGSRSALGADRAALSPDGDVTSEPIRWIQPIPIAGHSSSGLNRSPFFLSVNDDPEGDIPRELAFTRDGTQVVIANSQSDTATFFNVASKSITHTVNVGDYPVHVAVSPNNQYAVIATPLSNDVSVVDIATHTLAARIPVTGLQPYRIAITPDSHYAIAGVINDAVNSAFSIIDLTTLSELSSFPSTAQGVIGFYFTPESGISGELFTQFALTPDGSKILLPDRAGGRVSIYNRATGALLANPATAVGATAVDVSADGTLAVVSHEPSTPGAIATIDLTTLATTHVYSTTDGLTSEVIRITPDKTHAIAAISNFAIFVNLATGARAATLSTGSVGDIELSYDGQYAFVSNFNASVISVATRTIVKSVTFAACAESAASPTELRAVALNNRFREDVQLYNINGASSFLEGYTLSGEPPEGDAPHDLAISQDGRLVVACNNTSRNVSIVDMITHTVRSYVDVGERPLDAAITPDNAYAVVCAADGNAVVIIDLATDTVVKTLSIFSRPARIRISPDGQWAYVLNVAGTDAISFIQLAGAASTIVNQVTNGLQTGSIGTNISGVELSHNGATFAVCDSFNNFLRLYDTVTRTQVAAVPVGTFPIRVAFSPDDSKAYVTNANSDNVSVVNVAGAGSSLIGNAGTMDFPITVDVDSTGSFVYVGSTGSSPGLRVIDAATRTIVKTVTFANSAIPLDSYLSWTDGRIYMVGSDATLKMLSAAGAGSALLETTALTPGSPWDMVFDNARGVAVIAQPVPDGVDVVTFGCVGDITGDRMVDLSDLAKMLSNYSKSPATYAEGNINNDGLIDLADVALLLSVYGNICP